jgi:hypothetical protein
LNEQETAKKRHVADAIGGTGRPRSGRGEISFDWNPVPGDYSVDVVVTPGMWSSRWDYSMSCPVAMSSQVTGSSQ